MNKERILIFILAAALLAVTVNNLIQNIRKSSPDANIPFASEAQTTSDKSEIVFENILTRASVRDYTTQKVPKELLEKIVRAGMAAPTARNTQPWKFFIVDDPTILLQLAEKLPYAKMLSKAPAAIIVCGDLDKAQKEKPGQEYWIQDCSAATENILLAAHAFGLGAVWTGGYPSMDRANAVASALKLPANLIALNVIPIGYPKGEVVPKDKWKAENLIWNEYKSGE